MPTDPSLNLSLSGHAAAAAIGPAGIADVLVVGAGPAGSAAAMVLARAGWHVVLADAQAFPRDKVCGDGLIRDAHNALDRLGLRHSVLAAAQHAEHVACIGPRGARVRVPGTLAVLPRRELDLLLCKAAVSAGATMLAPARYVAPLPPGPDGRAHGAMLEDADGVQHPVRARWTVLATGAVPQALMAAGLCDRRTPSGIAMRGYIHLPGLSARVPDLEVVWHPKLKPGYGWVFPCPGDVYNIGVGVAHSHDVGRNGRHAMRDVNLHQAFAAFTALHPAARELAERGTWVGEMRGAPLRCSLGGGRLSAPGVLVTGEAAGSTYAFTGEGIGKALETGIAAADCLLAHRGTDAETDGAVRSDYEERLRALAPRYDVYEKAGTVNTHPWLVDLLVWSAKRSPGRLQRMSGVLEETHLPRNLKGLGSWSRLLYTR